MSLGLDGKKFKTHIPAGVKDGQKIRLAGKGHAGLNGGAHGDLYLTVHVKADKRFSMRGRDVLVDLPLTVPEAALGGKVDAKDIDGNIVTFKVPAGSGSGTEVRLKGKGVQNPKGNGDLIGVVSVKVPGNLSLLQKKALKEFASHSKDFSEQVAAERLG